MATVKIPVKHAADLVRLINGARTLRAFVKATGGAGGRAKRIREALASLSDVEARQLIGGMADCSEMVLELFLFFPVRLQAEIAETPEGDR